MGASSKEPYPRDETSVARPITVARVLSPVHVAPYEVIVTPIGKDEEPLARATEIYDALLVEGIEVLLDDRSERPGVKFKDADLIGIPLRITVGSRGLKQGTVELKKRTETESEDVPTAEIISATKSALVALGS